jgi:hypothetical protein
MLTLEGSAIPCSPPSRVEKKLADFPDTDTDTVTMDMESEIDMGTATDMDTDTDTPMDTDIDNFSSTNKVVLKSLQQLINDTIEPLAPNKGCYCKNCKTVKL